MHPQEKAYMLRKEAILEKINKLSRSIPNGAMTIMDLRDIQNQLLEIENSVISFYSYCHPR